jgi:hypothetical protein
MDQNESSPEPILFIRKLQQNYINYYILQAATGQAVEGITVYHPKEKRILIAQLPSGIRAQLQEYKDNHPEQEITGNLLDLPETTAKYRFIRLSKYLTSRVV